MPTNTAVSSNYTGKVAGAIIGASFKEADTIMQGAVTFAQNVGHKLNMRRIRYTDGRQVYSCGFAPAGTITLSERVLEPVKVKNDLQICKEDFRATWSEDLLGGSAFNPNSPSDIMTAIQTEVLSETAEDTDNLIWNGDSANGDEWDGFITLFGSDADVIIASDGTVVNAAVSKSNVLAAFDNATALIPVSLRKKPLVMAVGPDVADAYVKKLIESGVGNGLGGDANTQLVYGRYKLTVLGGLPDNTIVIYEKKNLVFGTGLMQDFNEFKLVDEDEIGLLTGQVRGKMVYSGGAQYYNSEDIVWYVTTVA